MNLLEWVEEVKKAHNPALASKEACDGSRHVKQIWEDGEHTSQKGGELLWQRTLHTFAPGLPVMVDPKLMPAKSGEHGYAFVTSADATRLRGLLEEIYQGIKGGKND